MGQNGYSLREAADILGEDYEKFKTRARRGQIRTFEEQEGKRKFRFITKETLDQLRDSRVSTDYDTHVANLLASMRDGTYSGRPLSPKYVKMTSDYLARYWTLLGLKPSIDGITAQNYKKVVSIIGVDGENRNDHYHSKHHIYKALNTFLNHLISEGYAKQYEKNALRELLPKPMRKKVKAPIIESEIQQALDFNRTWLDGRSTYDAEVMDILIRIYSYAGLRKMEAATLRVSDVMLTQKTIHVRDAKGGKDRLVPIQPELHEHLENWIAKHCSGSKTGLLITQQDGKQHTESSIGQRFKRFAKELKLNKEFAAHQLRKSCATILAKKGMPVPLIQNILGHEDIKTTLRYLLITEHHVLEWMEKNLTKDPVSPPLPESEQSESQPKQLQTAGRVYDPYYP